LIDRAIEAVQPEGGHYASVDHDDLPRLSIDGDNAVLTWREYESDYYGGGYQNNEIAPFPAFLLSLGEAEFKAVMSKTKREIAEREAKVRAAQDAVSRDRQEAHERAVLAALQRKYGSQ
jgi:hypothetical protein